MKASMNLQVGINIHFWAHGHMQPEEDVANIWLMKCFGRKISRNVSFESHCYTGWYKHWSHTEKVACLSMSISLSQKFPLWIEQSKPALLILLEWQIILLNTLSLLKTQIMIAVLKMTWKWRIVIKGCFYCAFTYLLIYLSIPHKKNTELCVIYFISLWCSDMLHITSTDFTHNDELQRQLCWTPAASIWLCSSLVSIYLLFLFCLFIHFNYFFLNETIL